jgi:AcrR family transcriptional regulator
MTVPDGEEHRMTVEKAAINRRERKKAETRNRIIESAALLFQRNGYQATSIEDITEAADVAPRTFYSYFDAKADVAMVQLDRWNEDLAQAMEARPAGETLEEMVAGALAMLDDLGYVNSQRLRDEDGRPFPPLGVGLLMAETEPEVAGRIYQSTVRFQDRMTALFRERFRYPAGSIEPRVLAATLTASWFVAVYGFGEVAEVDPDPPSTDDLGLQSLQMFASGVGRLIERHLLA